MENIKNKEQAEGNFILDGCKLKWHEERVNQWLRGERIAPITIDCALTTHCSYRCKYCYGQMQLINQKPNLSPKVIDDFLDDAAEIGVKAISFVSDGESTCNPYLYDAIIRGKRNGIDMALGTNGYLLKEDRLEDILPCLTYLRFNISAGEKEAYCDIHGVGGECYDKVISTIRKAVEIKNKKSLDVTIGLQMVLIPELKDQIIPLAKLGKELGVDYLVIKHCSDDENHTLGVEYEKYYELEDLLHEAEAYSAKGYQVSVKWSKIMSGGKRGYKKCFGPQFQLQMSGSGIVAPCGSFFNEKYSKYHIGDITKQRFKDIWLSERYMEVMDMISSESFDARTDCESLCLQEKVNEFLNQLDKNHELEKCSQPTPQHVNFI
ncbi:MAG: radical SAM protein [Lachnospiraceae bacterium]|jgi:MoaA/NifB/PqqE/SkfB family radical SAM enzyme|nr:radical SAM protein [Lachnospiraceae bacterium]